MSRGSDLTTEEILHSDYFDDLVFFLMNLDTEDKVKDFILGVLTPGEAWNIIQRITIVESIKAGYTHRHIAKLLGVSIRTVSRASRQIQEGNFVILYDTY